MFILVSIISYYIICLFVFQIHNIIYSQTAKSNIKAKFNFFNDNSQYVHIKYTIFNSCLIIVVLVIHYILRAYIKSTLIKFHENMIEKILKVKLEAKKKHRKNIILPIRIFNIHILYSVGTCMLRVGTCMFFNLL